VKTLRIVQIIPDDRDVQRKFDKPMPFFGPAPSALLEGFSLLDHDIEIHVVSCARKLMPAPEKLADNIHYHQILVPGGHRRTLFSEAVRKLRRAIRMINPDVVHGQGTEDYPGICAAFSGYPNCITIHGNMRAVARQMSYRPFPVRHITCVAEYIALGKTDAVVCNSAYTDRCVGKLANNKPRIGNAVRSEFFEATWENPGTPHFLCIGRITPYKNQMALIPVIDRLQRDQGLELTFIGDASESDPYVQRFLDEVAKRNYCHHIPSLNSADLIEKMRGAVGLLHPTLEDSFGLVVAEAQTMGLPVAASDCCGIQDLIRIGETGLLFDPHSTEDLYMKGKMLLNNAVSEKLAKQGPPFAEAHYHPVVVARQHLRMYRQLLNGWHEQN
jgi:L-malate glycosyltransferase